MDPIEDLSAAVFDMIAEAAPLTIQLAAIGMFAEQCHVYADESDALDELENMQSWRNAEERALGMMLAALKWRTDQIANQF